MLETWQQMTHVRLNEPAASQWFSPDGVREPRQPHQNTITNGIRRFGKNDPMALHNLRAVEKEISDLNKGAHPTVLAVMQTDTPDPDLMTWLLGQAIPDDPESARLVRAIRAHSLGPEADRHAPTSA